MITRIDARSPSGTVLSLPFEIEDSGFLVANVDGLGPVPAQLVSSSYAEMDGAQYQTSRREARYLVIKVALEPDYSIDQTVEDMRDELYAFFMPKSEVHLTIFGDKRDVEITGRVESCEPDIFTMDPMVNISITCFKPDFLALDSIVIEEDSVSNQDEILITNPGSVESGILFTFMPDRNVSEFTIYHRRPDGVVDTLEFVTDLIAGDILTINTVPREKYVRLNRGGVISSALAGKSPYSGWIQLLPKDNHIRVYASGLPVPYTIEYIPRYGAVT